MGITKNLCKRLGLRTHWLRTDYLDGVNVARTDSLDGVKVEITKQPLQTDRIENSLLRMDSLDGIKAETWTPL